MTDSTSYFSAPVQQSPTGGTWTDLGASFPAIEMTPGLEFRPVVSDSMMLNLIRFEPNTVAPVHAHDEEQISLVMEGEVEFDVNGEVRRLGPNMVVVIPPNVPHGARTYDGSALVVDAFHPPRQALIEAMKARG